MEIDATSTEKRTVRNQPLSLFQRLRARTAPTCLISYDFLSQAGTLCVSSAFGNSGVVSAVVRAFHTHTSDCPKRREVAWTVNSVPSEECPIPSPSQRSPSRRGRHRFVHRDQRRRRNDLLRLDVVDFHAFQSSQASQVDLVVKSAQCCQRSGCTLSSCGPK